jgi:O-glycosyl hydrolase
MKSELNYWRKAFLLVMVSTLLGCAKQVTEPGPSGKDRTVTIHMNERKQTIQNFGASDAWCIQFIGGWPDEKRNQVADWLFSMENDSNGKPQGIGLSLWRFNIGAGSMVQGNISDEWRSTEGFLNDNLTYDWTRQSNQQWFLNAAKQRGVERFLGFTNSPPVQLTKNGKAFSSNGEEANIAPENYKAFAKFLVDVAKHFKEQGTPFTYVSPFNEPQWDWTGNGQEGSPYTNTEIFAITKLLDSTLTAEELDTKIQIGEAGKLNYLYEKADKSTRGDQIREFFDSASPIYVGNLSHVDRIISGHSYFTSAPAATLRSVRENLALSMTKSSVPLEFWQSEYCILGDQEEITASGKDTGIAPALYIARIIHHDLAIANASAWHWWLSVSAYDYKDGLIYVEKKKTDGLLEDTKALWAMGNFSRFIRPGSQRLNISSGLNINDADGLMVSSYLNVEDGEIITVIVNYGQIESSLSINLANGQVVSWKPYLTGPGADEKLKPLSEVSTGTKVVIPKRSVLTLVGKLK